jgi:hypothetical protein
VRLQGTCPPMRPDQSITIPIAKPGRFLPRQLGGQRRIERRNAIALTPTLSRSP